MISEPQRVNDLLEHIVDAIDRINRYTSSGETEFFKDEMHTRCSHSQPGDCR